MRCGPQVTYRYDDDRDSISASVHCHDIEIASSQTQRRSGAIRDDVPTSKDRIIRAIKDKQYVFDIH